MLNCMIFFFNFFFFKDILNQPQAMPIHFCLTSYLLVSRDLNHSLFAGTLGQASWVRLRGAGPRDDVISAVGLKYTTSGSRFGACSSLATLYLLWLRLDVKVGFCVWRLVFASKRCRAWNKKSTRWQTGKKWMKINVTIAFSVRSIARKYDYLRWEKRWKDVGV